MNAEHATRLLLRLQSHWPTLAADELAAADWLSVLSRLEADAGAVAANRLIATWTKDRTPKIGDWQEFARAAAAGGATQLAVMPPKPKREVVTAALTACREALSEGSAKLPRRMSGQVKP